MTEQNGEYISLQAAYDRTSAAIGNRLIAFVSWSYDHYPYDPLEDDGVGQIYSRNPRHINYLADCLDLAIEANCPVCEEDDLECFERPASEIFHCPECGADALFHAYWLGYTQADFGPTTTEQWRCECGREFLSIDARITTPPSDSWQCSSCGELGTWDHFFAETDAVLLGYFEHGRCLWHVSTETPLGTEGDYRWDGVRNAGIWQPDEYVLEAADQLGLKAGTAERRRWMRDQARAAAETYTAWCNGDVYVYSLEIHEIQHWGGDPANEILDDRHDYRFAKPIAEDCCGGFYFTEHMFEHINDTLHDFGFHADPEW